MREGFLRKQSPVLSSVKHWRYFRLQPAWLRYWDIPRGTNQQHLQYFASQKPAGAFDVRNIRGVRALADTLEIAFAVRGRSRPVIRAFNAPSVQEASMWASAIIAAARQPTIQAQAPLARQGQSMYSQAMAGSRVIHPSPVQRAPQLLPMSTLEPGKLYPVVQLPAGHAMQVAPSLQRVFLGLGWTNATSGKTVDVDAQLHCI